MGGFAIFVIILLLLAVVTVFAGIKIVPQGYNVVIERFGRYTKTLEPGLNVILPYVERVRAQMNMQELLLDVPEQMVITKDNSQVMVDGIAFYQVLDAKQATYEVANLQLAIKNLIITNIRAVMGAMDLDDLLSNRDQINQSLLDVVDKATSNWGVKVTRVEIKDIRPPQSVIDAMAKQLTADREKRASISAAEGLKQAAILKAEGEKQASIVEAEGEQQAAILRAEGEKQAAFLRAEAREREAAAEARATAMLSQAISNGNVAAVNYFVAQKYIEALGQFANSPNEKILMLPVEAASVIGSIAGIAEIAKQTFGDQKTGG